MTPCGSGLCEWKKSEFWCWLVDYEFNINLMECNLINVSAWEAKLIKIAGKDSFSVDTALKTRNMSLTSVEIINAFTKFSVESEKVPETLSEGVPQAWTRADCISPAGGDKVLF